MAIFASEQVRYFAIGKAILAQSPETDVSNSGTGGLSA